MSVRVSWNAGVTQVDNEPVSFSISDHESLVGNLAVSSNPLQGVAQGVRGRHDVIQEPDFAQIEIAGQREAETIILQSLRRLVQERDRQAAEATLRHWDRGQVLLG